MFFHDKYWTYWVKSLICFVDPNPLSSINDNSERISMHLWKCIQVIFSFCNIPNVWLLLIEELS